MILERVIATMLLTCCALAAGLPRVSGQSGFALVSPDAVATLSLRGETAEAKAVIRAAGAAARRQPNALARVHTEGTLPHQGIHDESIVAMRDWTAMRDLGLAFALSHDATYLRAVERYFSAWLAVYHTSLNPIDETGLDSVIIAHDLVGARLSEGVRRNMAALMRDMAAGYLAVKPDPRRTTTTNNWQSHRVKLIALAAFGLNESALIAEARRAFQVQLDANLRQDGSTIDFEQRDALHYVVYDLDPLLIAALAAKAHGWDWYSLPARNGASLDAALRWLEPYAMGERTHKEFARTTVNFDRTRAAAGMSGFSGRWKPKDSAMLYQVASRFRPGWTALAMRLGPAAPWLALCFPL